MVENRGEQSLSNEADKAGFFKYSSALRMRLQVFTNRNYRIFFFTEFIALMGIWMQSTAQGWLVLQIAPSPLQVGFVVTFQTLPMLFFLLLGGAVADRLPKRQILWVTQAIALALTAVLGLLVATQSIQLWHIYGIALAQGLLNALASPAREAFAMDLVGTETVTQAIGLYSVLFNGSRVIGPALAGFLIAALGIAPTLFASTFGYMALMWGLCKLEIPSLPASSRPKDKKRGIGVREGLDFVRSTPRLMFVVLTVSGIGVFGYTFSVTLPLVAKFVLKNDALGYSILSSFLGVGALIAAIQVAFSQRATEQRLLVYAIAFSILLIPFALSLNFWTSAALLVGLGLAGMEVATLANIRLQELAPPHFRGRVVGLYMFIFTGTAPIGALFIGASANRIGISSTLIICAALSGIGVVAALVYRRFKVQSMAV